jgi:hypothetical protein
MALPPEQPTTQPEPAEGPRDGDTATGTFNEGVSAEAPVEGADDTAPEQPGSPRG